MKAIQKTCLEEASKQLSRSGSEHSQSEYHFKEARDFFFGKAKPDGDDSLVISREDFREFQVKFQKALSESEKGKEYQLEAHKWLSTVLKDE